jgi:hypothetical protein
MARIGLGRRIVWVLVIVATTGGCTSSALFSPPEGAPPRPESPGAFPTLSAETPPRDQPLMTPQEIAAREQAMRAAGDRARREAGSITGATRN